jgi:leader peptidase (prepilin peptidase)/N-methyltransferase
MSAFLPLVILVCYGSWLSVIDIRSHRLPNKLVATMTVLLILVQLALAITYSQLNRLSLALLTALATTLAYSFLYAASRGSMGMGDVKFAFPLGLVIGWYSPKQWLMAMFLTFALAGVVALIGIAIRRTTWKSQLALGPYMFLATVIVCAIPN